jgi:hypothetical protein
MEKILIFVLFHSGCIVHNNSRYKVGTYQDLVSENQYPLKTKFHRGCGIFRGKTMIEIITE